MAHIIVPERSLNTRWKPEALAPVAQAQRFETPYPARTCGRFIVLVDRSWPRTRYGFCLEADPLSHHVPSVFCWVSPFSQSERAERLALRQNFQDRIDAWLKNGAGEYPLSDEECEQYNLLALGRIELTLDGALREAREAEAQLTQQPAPRHLAPLSIIERYMLRLLDAPSSWTLASIERKPVCHCDRCGRPGGPSDVGRACGLRGCWGGFKTTAKDGQVPAGGLP